MLLSSYEQSPEIRPAVAGTFTCRQTLSMWRETNEPLWMDRLSFSITELWQHITDMRNGENGVTLKHFLQYSPIKRKYFKALILRLPLKTFGKRTNSKRENTLFSISQSQASRMIFLNNGVQKTRHRCYVNLMVMKAAAQARDRGC